MVSTHPAPSLSRRLLAAAVFSFVLASASLLALHAASAVLCVAAIAAVTVMLGWFARLSDDEERSGLALVNPAWAAALTAVRRQRPLELLPTVASQVLGALLAAALIRPLATGLGEPLLFSQPRLTTAALVGALGGVVGAWTVLAVDGSAPDALLTVAPVLTGAGPTVVLVVAAHPAAVLAVAAAGLLSWAAALVTIAAGLVGAVLGACAVTAITPPTAP